MTGFHVDPDELRERSVDLAAAAEAVRQLEPVVTRALSDADVLASAALSPGSALRVERALWHAATNPAGLGLALAGGTVADLADGIGTALGGRGLAEELAADAVSLRISAVTYERPELATSAGLQRLTAQLAEGEQGAAARTLADLVEAAAMADVAVVAPELVALHALLDENPLNDPLGWEILHGDPSTVDPIVGLPLGPLARVLDPGRGHATRERHTGPRAQALVGRSAGIGDRLGTLAELGNDGRVVVETVRGQDGTQRWVVQLPGMRSDDPVTGDPQDLAGAVRAATLPDSAYSDAVREAMRLADVPRGAQLLLVGHSAGGVVAMNLTADPAFNGGTYVVTDALAVGSPVDHKAVPAGTGVVTVTNDRDLVPALDGRGPASPEPVAAGRTEIRVDSGQGGLPAAHAIATYRQLLAAPGPDGTSALDVLDAQLAAYTGGTVTDVQTFRLSDGALVTRDGRVSAPG